MTNKEKEFTKKVKIFFMRLPITGNRYAMLDVATATWLKDFKTQKEAIQFIEDNNMEWVNCPKA